jgi:hypothetical protein
VLIFANTKSYFKLLLQFREPQTFLFTSGDTQTKKSLGTTALDSSYNDISCTRYSNTVIAGSNIARRLDNVLGVPTFGPVLPLRRANAPSR